MQLPLTRLAPLLSVGLLALSLAAQTLPLPPRAPGALLGSQIQALLPGLSVEQREAFLWGEFAAGNVPGFLRQLVTVSDSAVVSGQLRSVSYRVTPDYLGVGSDSDWFRIPMTPVLGQQLADLCNCSLPTRKMVDRIHAAASVQLAPFFYSPSVYNILSPSLFYQHHLQIESQRAGQPQGLLTSGIKKDVVVSPRVGLHPDRVTIYGWHQLNGVAIQPLSSVHILGYADYSHGIRLVEREVDLDGVAVSLPTLLQHGTLNVLVSDEGAFTSSRYQVPPPPEDFPLIDAFPAGGRELASWRDRFATHGVVPFSPPAPGGDGYVLKVNDPAGGTDSARLGSPLSGDQIVQADLYCAYRPQLVSNGYERIGLFARDNAGGNFDGTLSQAGACYAITWDGDDGRLRCARIGAGGIVDLLPAPLYVASSGWRRFRIEAVGSTLRFSVDGALLLETTDSTYAQGEFGIGYHENFANDAFMLGTRADNFFADLPGATRLVFRSDAAGDLVIEHVRGVPGNEYFNALTTTAGSFPQGWFFGLDIAYPELIAQAGSSWPAFRGLLDDRGEASFTVPFALPSGFSIYGVSLELDPFGQLGPITAPESFVLP